MLSNNTNFGGQDAAKRFLFPWLLLAQLSEQLRNKNMQLRGFLLPS